MCPKKDNTVQNEKFDHDSRFSPFIEWNYESHPIEFNRLINGKAVNIFADINQAARKSLEAVKFLNI